MWGPFTVFSLWGTVSGCGGIHGRVLVSAFSGSPNLFVLQLVHRSLCAPCCKASSRSDPAHGSDCIAKGVGLQAGN